ncbi:MAG: alpha/beta hydrolase [Hyphomicrobiaceae bacterium]|nr:MAG: alpha/beta hydrolase [Hyphomicrobiaceae bacterium]
MADGNPQIIEIASGEPPRRIACLVTPGATGGSPGLVWLPGFRSDMVSTKATALAEWVPTRGLALTRFDYSGHGRSGGRFEDMTVGHWLEDAETVIAALTHGPQVLVGSSMGGWIALLLAQAAMEEGSRLRNRVAGLILIAPAWDMTETLIKKTLPEDARQALKTTGVWLRPSNYGDGPYPITRKLLQEGQRHLIAGGLNLDRPVRIIHGMQDPDVPWRHSLDLVSLLGTPDVRLTLIKDGEHRLSRTTDLSLLLGTIDELLATPSNFVHGSKK